MESALRKKYTAKYPQFSSAPSWTTSNDLGKASSQTAGTLLGNLGIGGFSAPGNDYVQDILKFLTAATQQTDILKGLFTEVIQRGSGSIEVYAAADMYGSSSGGAIMCKFIKALLADAENSSKIAIPGKTTVLPGPDRKSVIVAFNLKT